MSSTLSEGATFAGRYRIVRCIAAGGMGAVYEAVHLDTDRRRALKVMHPHLFQSDEMRERFKREARISAMIESEHIVDVSDAGVDEATKTPFLVMELLRGEDLGVRITRLGRLPASEALTFLQQTAMALDKTHASAIVHRDLKPENLFLTEREDGSPRIKILDFGVAKLVAEGATAAGQTRSLGTPLYMAPEQFRTSARLTPAADVCALGLMAYTLLVGKAYWETEAEQSADLIAFAMTVVQGVTELPSVRAAREGVALPPGFDAWFMKITAVNPTDRHPTASSAIRALHEVFQQAAGAGPAALPVPPAPSLRAPIQGVPSQSMVGFEVTRPSGSPSVARASTLAGQSTSASGAPLDLPPPKAKSRAPLAIAAGFGVIALGVVGFFALRLSSGGSAAPAGDTTAAQTAATSATSTQSSPEIKPATTSASPEITPAGTTSAAATTDPAAPVMKPVGPRPAATSTSKATPSPTIKPTATSTAKPGPTITKPLLGRD